MYKVFAFLRRNTTLLSHDDYRAGHVGYHCGQSRRLKDIRGYLVNIWSNTPIRERLGEEFVDGITIAEPDDFLEWWDGFPEVYFDNQEAWVNALNLEPTRATADGLVVDPDWSLDDGPRLFDPVLDRPGEFKPCHLRMHEQIVTPVERAEQKVFKLMQFFKLKYPDSGETAVREGLAPTLAILPGCHGCIINFRDADQDAAMRGFYPDDSWGHGEEGRAHRTEFCSYFDGAIEYHFTTADDFVSARTLLNKSLLALESQLFSRSWWLEVDENLVVMPNRATPPEFYFR